MPAWIPYTVLRLVLFGGTFALVYVLLAPTDVPRMVAALIAAVAAVIVSMAVSYIFFSKLRDRVASELAASRERAHSGDDIRGEDERAEDGE